MTSSCVKELLCVNIENIISAMIVLQLFTNLFNGTTSRKYLKFVLDLDIESIYSQKHCGKIIIEICMVATTFSS